MAHGLAGLRIGTRCCSHRSNGTSNTSPFRCSSDGAGWSVETAIDFEETKGPALIWPYALLGETLGGSLNDLRLVSGLFFVLSVVPLLLLATRAGSRGASLLLAALGFMLLPYEIVFGQLVMGEASFLFGALWLVLIALWGFGDSTHGPHRWSAGAYWSRHLHSRIHAVAWAGAICPVAFQREGIRSWPVDRLDHQVRCGFRCGSGGWTGQS